MANYLARRHGEAGVRHPEGLEQPLRHNLAERLAREDLDEAALRVII